MNDVVLSILVPTYNQERYIETALNSILLQKVKYKYEILVGEDVSKDNTREILKKYEITHPNKVKVYYRDINLGTSSAKLDNHMDLYNRARGKYVIFLEGDDYWIDENKLEIQIDFLEKHPDYIAVAHNCIVVDENGKQRHETYPECKDTEYTLKHYVNNILPGQLATVMMRNIYRMDSFPTDMWEKRLVPGDRIFYFTLLANGKMYCIQKAMSAYRYVTTGGSSYSANVRYNFQYDEYWHKELCSYAYSTNKNPFVLCAETLYFACLVRGIKYKSISFKNFLAYSSNVKNKTAVLKQFILVYTPVAYRKFINMLKNIKIKN